MYGHVFYTTNFTVTTIFSTITTHSGAWKSHSHPLPVVQANYTVFYEKMTALSLHRANSTVVGYMHTQTNGQTGAKTKLASAESADLA